MLSPTLIRKPILRYLAIGLLAFGNSTVSAADIDVRDVYVYNKSDDIRLGGTLTQPIGVSPKAAIVLASGSGAQNRDEEVFGHRPFKRIAEFLSAQGYAVLRLDDRGVGESDGDYSSTTIDSDVRDIAAAFGMLDSCYSHRIPFGIIGHSAGGSAAIRAAVTHPECDFIITLAAPAWSGDSIVMSQSRTAALAMTGRWDAEATQRKLMELVKSDLPDFVISPMIYVHLAESMGDMLKMDAVKSQIDKQIEAMLTPAYRSFIKYDPSDDIKQIDKPWLALNGAKDTQVLPANLDTFKALNNKVDTMLLDGHNHLFQECSTGLVQEYPTLPESISDLTLNAIQSWLDHLNLFLDTP